MALVDSNAAKQYMALVRKNIQELQTICQYMDISIDGTKDELIEKLLNHNKQSVIDTPHMFAIKSFNNDKNFLKEMRVKMFHYGKVMDLPLISPTNGKKFTLRRKTIPITKNECLHLINQNMIKTKDFQEEYLLNISNNIDNYETKLFLHQDKNNSSWLVMYVSPKDYNESRTNS